MSEIKAPNFEGNAAEYDDSRFINFSTLNGMGEVTMPVESVKGLEADFKFENGRTLGKRMLVLMFKTKAGLKGLRLNKTNFNAMRRLYGNTVKQWIGKKITLYADPTVKFGGKAVGGVKIKE